jgi:ferredoxin-NADP reductase
VSTAVKVTALSGRGVTLTLEEKLKDGRHCLISKPLADFPCNRQTRRRPQFVVPRVS